MVKVTKGSKAGKYYRYYATFGNKATKEFRTKSEAKWAATFLAKKHRRTVEYARTTIYPHARPGQTDWSVRFLGKVKPMIKKKR